MKIRDWGDVDEEMERSQKCYRKPRKEDKKVAGPATSRWPSWLVDRTMRERPEVLTSQEIDRIDDKRPRNRGRRKGR